MRARRGFTIAEMLTVMAIIGLILSAIAITMPLVLRAPSEVQSQVDNVNSAALALYKIQRDARQSTKMAIYNCSITPVPACAAPPALPATPAPAPALVMASGNGAGQFQLDVNGNLVWQGFVVYWLATNADRKSNDLLRAFYPIPNIDITQPQTANAVMALTSVVGSPSAVTVAQDVISIRAGMDPSKGILGLVIDGGEILGNTSSLRLTSNTYVRN